MELPKKRQRSDFEVPDDMQRSMHHFLDQFPIQQGPSSMPTDLGDVLEKLDQNVTCIKSSLEKKKPKITLCQLNEKMDTILEILKSKDVCLDV